MTKEDFIKLAEQYEQETGFMSSTYSMTSVPSFKVLIELGKSVLPFIIDRIRTERRGMNWHIVLQAITRETPLLPKEVVPGMYGWDVNATMKAWVAWFDKQNKHDVAN